MKILLLVGFVLLNLFFLTDQKPSIIRYMGDPGLKGAVVKTQPIFVDFKDTIFEDTLYLQLTAEGLPLSAYRKISTTVCVDHKCRRLEIALHWNITGRYLGFELPAGEFLSKTEHQPFSDEEYKRLHTLLSDPYSPLSAYSIDKLVLEKNKAPKQVDAVSSATNKDILNSVVQGAVYTTYTLWHLVYGNTQKEIKQLGARYFSESMAMQLLESKNVDDQIWVLDHLDELNTWSYKLRQKVLNLISDSNFYLSERALNSFTPEMMDSYDFQKQLYAVFESSGYSVQRLIILKFSKSVRLSDEIKSSLAAGLPEFKSSLAQNVLNLLIQHRVTDVPNCLYISELLNGKNKFIARKAYQYLDQLSLDDRKIQKRLKRYAAN